MSIPVGTRLSELLGIVHPLLQGGMTWVSRAPLAAAVSSAGGLGIIGSGGMDADDLREEIRAVRRVTAKPFGVNVPLINVRPDGDDDVVERLIDVVVDERVAVAVTGAGSPRRFTARLKDAGAVVLHVVPSVALAIKCQTAGVDAVVAESFEAGGHVASDGLSSFALIPQVVDAVTLPVVAAGGIADARGIVAALALGAAGVQIGTRFLATRECNAHAAYKRAVLEAESAGSAVYCRSYHASRALATPIVHRLIELEDGGASVEELRALRGRKRAFEGCIEGDVERGILPAGAAVGLVDELVSAADLVTDLMAGVAERIADLARATPARPRDTRAA